MEKTKVAIPKEERFSDLKGRDVPVQQCPGTWNQSSPVTYVFEHYVVLFLTILKGKLTVGSFVGLRFTFLLVF